MKRFYFTRPKIGDAIYADNIESVFQENELHTFSDLSSALNYLMIDVNSKKSYKIRQFLEELNKNENVWYRYNIEEIDNNWYQKGEKTC